MTWTFDKPAEVWKPEYEYFNLKVHIDEKKCSFFSKKLRFWSNCSCGLREFSSGTHADNSRQKSLFSRAQRPKKLKEYIIFPGKDVFLHGFPGHKKRCFDNSVSIFLLKSDFFLLKVQTFWSNLYIFQKNCFRPNVPLDTPNAASTHRLLCFLPKSKNYFFESSIKCQNCTHLSRFIFPQSVFWTRDLRFWQPGRKNFAKLRSFFTSECQSHRKSFLFFKTSKITLRTFHGTKRMQFDSHAGSFW